MKKTVLYLRTDFVYNDIISGGSVAHTLGVIQGFLQNNFEVACVTTCLQKQLSQKKIKQLLYIPAPRFIKILKWHLGSFFLSFIVFIKIKKTVSLDFVAIYQRYSLLNLTGVLAQWWYKKPFILEFNGSEVWMARQWSKTKASLLFFPLILLIEKIVLARADTVVVVSDVLCNQLIKKGICKSKILVNPNGVDSDYFDPYKKYENKVCVK